MQRFGPMPAHTQPSESAASSSPLRQTGGEALVSALQAHGVDTVFGLPGAQMYGFFDALQRSPLRVVGARHEQGCGYMAFGYASATGRPAVFSVVPGPGVLNAGAAALTAYGCNQPVLCLTGQVPTDFLDKGSGHLHEMPNQLATLRGFNKWAARIEHPAQVPTAVADAFVQMQTGRPGPAALEMPWNLFTEPAMVRPTVAAALPPRPAVDTDRIDQLARALSRAKAPMIFVGGGAIHAAAEIQQLAERLDAPVVGHRRGRGIVSNAHALGLTVAAANRLWAETDLVIGIGTRLEVPRWRWQWAPQGLTWARIDIDPAEMRRFTPDVAVIADAQDATAALLAAVERLGVAPSGRRPAIRAAAQAAEQAIQVVQPQMSYLRILRELLPDDACVTDELSQVGFTSIFGFPVYQPRTFISSGYQGNLGFGFPTALGVKVAHPDKPVVAICGDGGFQFGLQDLATAVQHRIGVIALVFNNSAYGNVRRDQLQSFDGRVIGADLVNPDFARLAEAYGAGGVCVDNPEAFRRALAHALKDGGPWVIEITVPRDSEANPWQFLHSAAPPPALP